MPIAKNQDFWPVAYPFCMSTFHDSIRALTDQYAPSIVFGARLGQPDEVPDALREKIDPWAMWSDQAAQSLGVAVQIAASQRLGREGSEEALAILAGLRLAYMKLVSDLADSMNIPEGELHNRINETMNNAQMEDKGPLDEGGPGLD